MMQPEDRNFQCVRTNVLDIAYTESGATHDRVALLLHGWPDDATTWRDVAPRLESAGLRAISPWLRGCGPTRFLSDHTLRDGRLEALVGDALDLMDALRIDRFAVVGHDWGARIAYALAALVPDRITAVVALSVGYAPRGAFVVPPFEQARAWWYQWFMSVDGGAEAVAKDPKGFARIQWDTWSPPGWFDDRTFDTVAASFDNPDWIAITLSHYRSRWRHEPGDPQHDAVQQRIASTDVLRVPTLMIQGSADGTVLAASTERKDRYFDAGYKRVMLDGVGHFPTREAPTAAANLVLEHLNELRR